jgi:hypothetical protein
MIDQNWPYSIVGRYLFSLSAFVACSVSRLLYQFFFCHRWQPFTSRVPNCNATVSRNFVRRLGHDNAAFSQLCKRADRSYTNGLPLFTITMQSSRDIMRICLLHL